MFLFYLPIVWIGYDPVWVFGMVSASLTLSLKRGGLILPLLILPLLAPVVIFGAGAVSLAMDGLGSGNALALLAAFAFAALLLSPFAAAASVRLNLGG